MLNKKKFFVVPPLSSSIAHVYIECKKTVEYMFIRVSKCYFSQTFICDLILLYFSGDSINCIHFELACESDQVQIKYICIGMVEGSII